MPHSRAQSRPLPNWPQGWPFPPSPDPVLAPGAMVVTTDAYATQVGVEVLRAGGNAVDAAVAVSFALAVVNPEAGNIGGGGFLVVRTAEGEAAALDFRSRAPRAATRDMFVEADGSVGERAVIGHLSAAVPGSVRGLWDAHRRFGRMRWSDLLAPAVRLARGFRIQGRFVRSYTPVVREGLGRFPASARAFLPGGAPPRVGDDFAQPDLTRTLERIQERGADGFYQGETAELFVREMERGGGIIAREDLEAYESLWREPVRFSYRGHEILSMPPSSSGGVTLAEIAGVLERYSLRESEWHGAAHVHRLAEAWRRAYADRNHYLADPDFRSLPVETLTSPAYAAWRARDISTAWATPSGEVGPGVEAYLAGDGRNQGASQRSRREGEHTTHYSIVDAEGSAVSVTTTINSWYGSKVTVEGAGFLLNNDMDDFTAKPGVPNQFGLVQGEANAIEPGKRMLSAMSPSLVLDPDGRLLLVLGSPGGSSIITTVFQVVSNVLDHGLTLAEAVHAPRVHHQHLPDQIFYEPGGLTDAARRELQGMGHRLFEREDLSGDVQAVLVHPDGAREGRSDPRRGGVARGY